MEQSGARRDNAIRLSDYRPPAWLVPAVALEFDLDPRRTRVRARLDIERNPDGNDGPLLLDGHGQRIERIAVDGRPLTTDRYVVEDHCLRIVDPPDRLQLEIETVVDPQTNTSLMGLYLSNGNYCTQCEAEGFRRIIWFPDRPDVLSVYTVTITADREHCPVLLSNGDPVERTDLGDGRHRARWHDPHPKPCYLFALVAGDLGHVHDRFTTGSGREVDLYVYAEHHNIEQCGFAMEALMKAMRWDEDVYGLEYDLDTYMIVAVDDFNMGAMENKGLNVFNSKYVLARPETATDQDYQAIEGVIGHEYFHNWSGNRVTCRDWFQLSLKEGFTVFRDQEFSADVFSRVKRIDDVNLLRTHQFPEDNGPLAHAVRPTSYVEINNFYTLTVYNKGAEIVRMLRNLLGWDGFRAGCDLYFSRHDGQAVTTDDFVTAMEDANGVRLDRFRLWYSQAGTPRLKARGSYDAGARRYVLTLTQSCPPTPGQADKHPFQIPVRTALFSATGDKLVTTLEGDAGRPAAEHVLDLSSNRQEFVFDGVDEAPIPSLVRGFSAPVMLEAGLDADQLAVLSGHDDDPFNRWDAGHQLASREILAMVEAIHANRPVRLSDAFVAAFRATVTAELEDRSFQASALTLPDEGYVAERMAVIEPIAVHHAREAVRSALAQACRDPLLLLYHRLAMAEHYRFDAAEAGRRALRNRCLDYLVSLTDEDMVGLAVRQFESADNMTDTMAALACLTRTADSRREEAMTAFYGRWRDYSLVVDKWFRLQALSPLPGALARVQSLNLHPAYHKENPNRVRALVGAFCHGNPAHFHADDGSGYRFLSDQVLQIDPINPQVAARLVSAFNQWRRYDEHRQRLMQAELERIQGQDGVSRDVGEIVGRTLAAG